MSEPDNKLPEGKTCADCLHLKRCVGLFNCPPTNTTCDWAPSRFRSGFVPNSTPPEGTPKPEHD